MEIKRIYNRVIVDELVRKGIKADFQFTDDLDVEWAGHPNWFFRLSKFSLPWFRHVSVPETWFLSDIKKLPDNLDDYVLKPLYSFAGLGVKIGPTQGRDRGDSGGPAIGFYSAAEDGFRADYRYAQRDDESRDPHHVYTRWRGAGAGDNGHPDGARQDDGRGFQ